MSATLDLLRPAASRATDVAALLDAARVLTFLARSRARQRASDPQSCSGAELEALYDTAARLSGHARALVAETERLLALAQATPVAGGADAQVDALRALMTGAMANAARALATLESIQALGCEELGRAAPPANAVSAADAPDAAVEADGAAVPDTGAFLRRLFARLGR